MYARVVTATIAPDRLEEFARVWRETVPPSARQQKGFKSARLLVERGSGRVLSVGLWETEADLQGSIAWNLSQVARFAGFFPSQPQVELYEVAAEV
jgi:heme-degrading monooxygenase HmoA